MRGEIGLYKLGLYSEARRSHCLFCRILGHAVIALSWLDPYVMWKLWRNFRTNWTSRNPPKLIYAVYTIDHGRHVYSCDCFHKKVVCRAGSLDIFLISGRNSVSHPDWWSSERVETKSIHLFRTLYIWVRGLFFIVLCLEGFIFHSFSVLYRINVHEINDV